MPGRLSPLNSSVSGLAHDTDPAGGVVRLAEQVRAAGIPVGVSQAIDLARALATVNLSDWPAARAAARCSLARRPDDFPAIDTATERFLRGLVSDQATPLPASEAPGTVAEPFDGSTLQGSDGTGVGLTAAGALTSRYGESRSGIAGYSPLDALGRKDFSAYTEAEIAEAKRLVRTMRWRPPLRRSRRRRPARHGRELDMRRLLRRSLAQGGEIVNFPRRAHRSKPRSLVVLCDISGSMDIYTRILLHFLHTLRSSHRQTEVFLFGTRLSRATPSLGGRDPDRALRELSGLVMDWSGGTRIGEALSTFNRTWARRVAAHGAVVMIISDGWDRGDPARLSREMARLRRLSHRLIWLNPLLGAEGYRPLTRGMQAALPLVDHFLPANDLASLEQLGSLLNGLEGRRTPASWRHGCRS